MRAFHYVITDEVGLHARPAGLLAKEAKNYASKITLEAAVQVMQTFFEENL